MSRRPTFWIHRTRRFWAGLGLLVSLVIGMLVIVHRTYEVSYSSYTLTGNIIAGTTYVLGLRDGGLQLERRGHEFHLGSLPSSPPTPSSHWTPSSSVGYDVRFLPSYESDEAGHFQLFLPATIPIILTCILWPLWMHRIDRKEMALYESKD